MFTLQLLAAVQRTHSIQAVLDSISFLKLRHSAPDLFIAGSLNVPPEKEHEVEFESLPAIARRARSLQYNVKIRAFQDSADMVSAEIECLLDAASPNARLNPRAQELIDGIVDASVLPVFPTDRNHLNPTYAFCASTGLQRDRVERSIADGCFQTFAALADAQSATPTPDLSQASRSVKPLVASGRIPHISWTTGPRGPASTGGACPYFQHSTRLVPRALGAVAASRSSGPVLAFQCPFYQAGSQNSKGIFDLCCADSAHLTEFQRH